MIQGGGAGAAGGFRASPGTASGCYTAVPKMEQLLLFLLPVPRLQLIQLQLVVVVQGGTMFLMVHVGKF